jgi:hypothetical protein
MYQTALLASSALCDSRIFSSLDTAAEKTEWKTARAPPSSQNFRESPMTSPEDDETDCQQAL